MCRTCNKQQCRSISIADPATATYKGVTVLGTLSKAPARMAVRPWLSKLREVVPEATPAHDTSTVPSAGDTCTNKNSHSGASCQRFTFAGTGRSDARHVDPGGAPTGSANMGFCCMVPAGQGSVWGGVGSIISVAVIQ